MKNEMKNGGEPILPKNVYGSRFVGSSFRDGQVEAFLCGLVITQYRMNPDQWTPFSWEEYVAKCDHRPTSNERHLLDTMVAGGEVVLNDMGRPNRIAIQAGYLRRETDRYVIAPKLLEVMRPYVNS